VACDLWMVVLLLLLLLSLSLLLLLLLVAAKVGFDVTASAVSSPLKHSRIIIEFVSDSVCVFVVVAFAVAGDGGGPVGGREVRSIVLHQILLLLLLLLLLFVLLRFGRWFG
jgi:hypothetical protein